MSRDTSEKLKRYVAFEDVDEAESVTEGDLSQSPVPSVSSVYSATNPIEVLEQGLRHYTTTSKEQGRDYSEFLPRDELERLLSEERTAEALEMALAQTEATDTYNSIRHATPDYLANRKEIVAILILSGKLETTLDFVAKGIDDNDLPFVLERGPGPRRTLNRRDSNGQLKPINLFSSWGDRDLEQFEAQQWKIHVPVFSEIGNRATRPRHWDLGERTILPYVSSEPIGRGGFGAVSKVELHPSHYNGVKDMAKYYAVKKLADSNADAFWGEVSSLRRFSHEEHPHLINLLWTFSRGSNYYLVFPCAKGNLMDLWEATAEPLAKTRDPDAARWVARQCLGIADGLRMIHKDTRQAPSGGIDKRHGRHGDLKPENILWFDDGDEERKGHDLGVLTISDFGLADFHDTSSKSGINTRLNNVPVSQTYQAPEYHVHEKIAQNYDIWSLGCVLLEFLMWYLKGWGEVQNFSRKRTADHSYGLFPADTFFNYVPRRDGGYGDQQFAAKPKQSVCDAFRDLYEDENASDFSNDLVELVKTKLLRLNPKARASCTEVYAEFKRIYDACEADSDYCLEVTKQPVKRGCTGLSILEPVAVEAPMEVVSSLTRHNVPADFTPPRLPLARHSSGSSITRRDSSIPDIQEESDTETPSTSTPGTHAPGCSPALPDQDSGLTTVCPTPRGSSDSADGGCIASGRSLGNRDADEGSQLSERVNLIHPSDKCDWPPKHTNSQGGILQRIIGKGVRLLRRKVAWLLRQVYNGVQRIFNCNTQDWLPR